MTAARTNAQIAETLAAMANVSARGDNPTRDGEKRLERFLKHKPSFFTGGFNPDGAVKWVEEVEIIFDAMECAEENKLTLETYVLREEANQWWKSAKLRLGGGGVVITWEMFKREFFTKYFLADVKNKKVVESRTENDKCVKFESGLRPNIKHIIGFAEIRNFTTLVAKARTCDEDGKAKSNYFKAIRGKSQDRANLMMRVACTLNCPVCDEEIEDELHIFFRCAVARDSWCAAGLSSVLHNVAYQQNNAVDRIFAVCSNESSDTVGRVAMLLWCIWHNLHKLQSNSVSGTTEADLVRWEKPALGWVKCNVDVVFVSGSGRTSVGLCFRDSSGQFMAGMTQWQQTVISSVEGEAWALLLAMEEARHRGLDRVQFESDSKVLIDVIHMKRRGNSEFLSIVHNILGFMSSCYDGQFLVLLS
ncbi:hypothetical protein TSUD_407520 [Trifolium subterraneum]|uniref:RNase H type-1 domain-containing protein n=1 Tax=Trifolium subterraneum TaxID=3900 RepID=A0A2Z6PQS4_TRISU|nr:hypothetical protein TSUD_407520 [Trifolium subterraneum]